MNDVSILQMPIFSLPKYSPSATWMESPLSHFSSACQGSLKGFSLLPLPPAAPALMNQSRPLGRASLTAAAASNFSTDSMKNIDLGNPLTSYAMPRTTNSVGGLPEPFHFMDAS